MAAVVAVAIGCDNVVTDACLCIFFLSQKRKRRFAQQCRLLLSVAKSNCDRGDRERGGGELILLKISQQQERFEKKHKFLPPPPGVSGGNSILNARTHTCPCHTYFKNIPDY